ncbi:MAG TPA: DUF488 domain-containing protein [Thermoleophilaceae bacterium]|nr:DUF488 domain-containing protein [Thermoleophilaceae bacterium]
MARLVTVGVYDWTRETFIHALREAGVTQLLDLRQRRGVRGPQYAWANSKRLQAALAEAGIAYEHLPELAPTTDLRHLQYAEDARQGVGKRSRKELAPAYVERFTAERLDQVELEPIVESMPADGAVALLCVERDPEACHRSLVGERIAERFGLPLAHLRP